MTINELLICIGVRDISSFETGLIAAAVAVILVLLFVFIVSRLCEAISDRFGRAKKAVTDKKYEEEIVALKKKLEMQTKSSLAEGATFALVLLQREGRLIDFLKENIDGYEDAQIGAAVREIHDGCAKVLNENFDVKPLFEAKEGESITLKEEFDPSEVKMTGNVPEKPPYKGVLKHKGWKIGDINLPTRTGKVNPNVIAPADIEF